MQEGKGTDERNEQTPFVHCVHRERGHVVLASMKAMVRVKRGHGVPLSKFGIQFIRFSIYINSCFQPVSLVGSGDLS